MTYYDYPLHIDSKMDLGTLVRTFWNLTYAGISMKLDTMNYGPGEHIICVKATSEREWADVKAAINNIPGVEIYEE